MSNLSIKSGNIHSSALVEGGREGGRGRVGERKERQLMIACIGEYIGIHLRVEQDWINSFRAYPTPLELLHKIYEYRNSTKPTSVCILESIQVRKMQEVRVRSEGVISFLSL